MSTKLYKSLAPIDSPPSPSPSLASAKVSCQGAVKFQKNTCLMISFIFIKKSEESLMNHFKNNKIIVLV